MKKFKLIAIVISLIMLFSIMAAGCVEKKTDNKREEGSESESITTEKTVKSKISFMYGDSGIDFGEVSKEDNPFINQIAEWANVEFTEIISPPYADYNQKLNLVLTSGTIPDVVHSYFQTNTINQFGMDGAFLPLEKYINERPILNEIYKDSIDIMKATDGNIYSFCSKDSLTYPGMMVRGDIIDDVNDGVMPKTPDEWYEVFKKIKAKYPDSIPQSGRGGIMYLDTFFSAYGSKVNGNGANWWLDIDQGKYVNDMEVPGTRAGVEFWRKLYAEGLLEKTFFTNSREDWVNRMYYNKFVMCTPGRYSYAIDFTKEFMDYSDDENAYCVYVRYPMSPGYNVTDYKQYGFAPGKVSPGGHMFSISAKTKDVDACLRLVETFFSKEAHDFLVYGRDGIEHTVKDGKKVLNYEKHIETEWRRAYLMPTYKGWTKEYGETLFIKLEGLDPSVLERQKKICFETMDYIDSVIYSYTPEKRYWNLVTLSKETSAKIGESQELSKSIILKAIVGEITMEQYDEMVKDYLNKYQFITDEYNEKLKEAKAKLDVK